ncbi:MAG: hypothetical protein HDT23_03515 [Ruminococcus sp.]|nr:hypothetical protein [Ruminococcus sp.]
MKQIYDKIKEDFRLKTEPDFRKLIQFRLTAEFGKNKNDKLYAIRTDKKWQWFSRLYHTVFTDDYQIYIMSMDKFLTKNSTIVEPSYKFIDSELVENAVIFIDEFDYVKETILNNIIKNGLDNRTDFIEMFRSVYSAMNTNVLP